jgi:peptidoglycan/LPS O-acetylase OafA/YrhL
MTDQSGNKTAKRNDGIDLLRGISIVLVIMTHLAIRIPLAKTLATAILPMPLIDVLCSRGYSSVFVFFVISGFLITGNALRRWGSLGQLQLLPFYTRRFARIVPCLLVLVALLSVLDLAHVRFYTILPANQSLPGAIFAALFMHLNWYEGRTGYLPGNWDVLWSLSIEEAFYLGFPLVCLLSRRSMIPFVVCLALLALSLPIMRGAIVGHEIWRKYAYLPGIAAIATGVFAALCAYRWRPTGATPLWLTLVGATSYAGFMLGGNLIWPVLGQASVLLLTIGVAALLLGLHWRDLPRWALYGTGSLRAFGRLSYEVYLSHMAVVFSAVQLFRGFGIDERWGFLFYPPVLALALSLGWTIARFVSQPAERWLLTRTSSERSAAIAF